jgi:hypothetical protein
MNAAEEIVALGEICRAMALAQPRWPHQCAQAPFSTDVPPARHWQHLTYGLLWGIAEN